MGKAVVLLFLLDTLPDYNKVINKTLHTVVPDINTVSCLPTINAAISDVVNRKLGFTSDSIERELQLPSDVNKQSYSFQDLSSETLYNTIYDNSIQDSSVDFFDQSRNIERNENEDVSECGKPSLDFVKFNNMLNSSKESYAGSPPFLAAIFETVSNVTAQTCGGVLVSTFWVLTAASCVNVLGHFYSNSSTHAVNNSYTIILGATNPLKDGTVHNVTEIILHPSSNVYKSLHSKSSLHSKKWFNSKKSLFEKYKSPTLALMRIEPGLKEGMLEIAEIRMDWNATAEMYGWALVQNETGHNAMLATLVPVDLLTPAKCESVYGTPKLRGSLCLSLNDSSPNITRMTSGGPVVAARGTQRRLLGVALSDSTPLLASAVLAHRDWIHKVIATVD